MSLWRLKSLLAACGGEGRNLPEGPVDGISIDSRTVTENDAFFAIKGDLHDGHKFVACALEAGAAVAIVDHAHANDHAKDAPLIIVDDVLKALERVGCAARTRSCAKIIAVTGSVGKTSTKDALRQVLQTSGRVHAAVASFNNHWGVPLTLARMPEETDFGVFEIGMNHSGEITPLVKMVRPHVVIITTVAPVHLEHFKDVEEIARAKSEIFDGLVEGGTAILNADNAHFDFLLTQARDAGVKKIVRFGSSPECEARLISHEIDDAVTHVHANIAGADLTYSIGAPGVHIAMNSLAVLCAAADVEADIKEAATAFSAVAQPSGRGARHHLGVGTGTALLIDESYNANPVSMRVALGLLGLAKPEGKGRRIAVLGDMLELGPTSDALHRGLVDDIVANQIGTVYCSGPMMKHLFDALPDSIERKWAPQAADHIDPLLDDVKAGDVIMAKGSLGSKIGPIVKALLEKYHAGP